MDSKYTRLDPPQIAKRSFDEEKDANRVTIVETEMAIAVSAAEGDSVQTAPMAQQASLETDEALDCLWARELILEASGPVTLEATIDGQNWFELHYQAQPRTSYAVMALQIRPKAACTMILRS